jgi:hypothetical protein
MCWSVVIEVIRSNEAGGNVQSMKSPSMYAMLPVPSRDRASSILT